MKLPPKTSHGKYLRSRESILRWISYLRMGQSDRRKGKKGMTWREIADKPFFFPIPASTIHSWRVEGRPFGKWAGHLGAVEPLEVRACYSCGRIHPQRVSCPTATPEERRQFSISSKDAASAVTSILTKIRTGSTDYTEEELLMALEGHRKPSDE